MQNPRLRDCLSLPTSVIMKSIITADSRYTKEFTMASSSKKSTTIVNQYQYTDPLMVEVQDGYAAQTYKNYITLIIIALICAFFTWREYTTHKGVLCILICNHCCIMCNRYYCVAGQHK